MVGCIPEGSIFGEFAMLVGEKRLTTVVALSFCELYCITKAQLDDLLTHWPEVAKDFLQVDNMLEVQGCTPEMKVRAQPPLLSSHTQLDRAALSSQRVQAMFTDKLKQSFRVRHTEGPSDLLGEHRSCRNVSELDTSPTAADCHADNSRNASCVWDSEGDSDLHGHR